MPVNLLVYAWSHPSALTLHVCGPLASSSVHRRRAVTWRRWRPMALLLCGWWSNPQRDKKRQKETKRDKKRQKETKRDKKRQKETRRPVTGVKTLSGTHFEDWEWHHRPSVFGQLDLPTCLYLRTFKSDGPDPSANCTAKPPPRPQSGWTEIGPEPSSKDSKTWQNHLAKQRHYATSYKCRPRLCSLMKMRFASSALACWLNSSEPTQPSKSRLPLKNEPSQPFDQILLSKSIQNDTPLSSLHIISVTFGSNPLSQVDFLSILNDINIPSAKEALQAEVRLWHKALEQRCRFTSFA